MELVSIKHIAAAPLCEGVLTSGSLAIAAALADAAQGDAESYSTLASPIRPAATASTATSWRPTSGSTSPPSPVTRKPPPAAPKWRMT